MKQRFLFMMIIGLLLLVISANAESGECGPNLVWTLDQEGVLTISGTGYMTSHPWDHSVKKVIIQNGTKNICDEAFNCCNELTEVSIPSSVTQIGKEAFWGCIGLTSVNIPNSVKTIDDQAFSNCINLESIHLPGNLQRLSLGLLSNCPALKEISIPASITCIDYSALAECTALKKITVPDSVKTIRAYAFQECSNVSEIILSKNIKEIDVGTFENCNKLSKITIPEGVTEIQIEAFCNCYELKSINIPASVTLVGEDAFKNCYSLQQISIPETNTYAIQWCKNNGYGGILRITAGPATATVKGLKYKLDNKAFTAALTGTDKKAITSLSVPATISVYGKVYAVTSIGNKAFINFTKLKKVTIGKNITSIGKKAFSGCKKLKTISIKTTKLKKVGSGAFKGISPKATIKCPKKQKDAYTKLLRKKGVPKTAKIK